MTSPNTIIADLTAEVESLRKQRDELLEAVELIYSWAHNWDSEFMNDQEWTNQDYPKIQAIVANAKGESC